MNRFLKYIAFLLLGSATIYCAHNIYKTLNSGKRIIMNDNNSVVTWFKNATNNPSLMHRLKTISLIIADIDGSLTDGRVECRADGEGTRYFSTQDGYGTKRAMEAGIAIAFVSGKGSGSGLNRARILAIPEKFCVLGSEDKRIAVKQLQLRENISEENTLIFGDDILDAQVKIDQPNSFFVCPNNSPFYIQGLGDLVIPRDGGHHAFRLLLDLLLYARGQHQLQTTITSLIT